MTTHPGAPDPDPARTLFNTLTRYGCPPNAAQRVVMAIMAPTLFLSRGNQQRDCTAVTTALNNASHYVDTTPDDLLHP